MNDLEKIKELSNDYFESIFSGDVERLRSTFHPHATLSGEIKGQPYYKSLEEYLEIVKNRKSPKQLGETFLMKVLHMEILGEIAFVKTHCPMLGFNYYDYLSLVKFEGKWGIISKVFTHIDPIKKS